MLNSFKTLKKYPQFGLKIKQNYEQNEQNKIIDD